MGPILAPWTLLLWCTCDQAKTLSDKASYRKISQSISAEKLGVDIVVSPWNLTGSLAAVLPGSLSNFKVIRWFWTHPLQRRDFANIGGKKMVKAPSALLLKTPLIAGSDKIVSSSQRGLFRLVVFSNAVIPRIILFVIRWHASKADKQLIAGMIPERNHLDLIWLAVLL